jgi:hypothetical protein
MLYREIIAVCSELYTKHINTLCGQNVEFLYVKIGVTQSNPERENGPRITSDTEPADRRPLTAEALVRSLASSYEICGGQSDIGTGFSPTTFGPPVSEPLRHVPHSFHHTILITKSSRRGLEP